jgi:hypothetical protein
MTTITAYIAEVRGRIKAFRDVYPVSYANRSEHEDLDKLTRALELAVESLGIIGKENNFGIGPITAQDTLTQIEQVLK